MNGLVFSLLIIGFHSQVLSDRVDDLEEALKVAFKKILKVETKVGKNDDAIWNLDDKIETNTKTLNHHTEDLNRNTNNLNRNTENLNHSIKEFNATKKELNHLKERGMVDALHPINSIYITFANIQPPLNGQYGIQWELLPEGYVLMTTNNNNVGSRSGEQRIDGGGTQGHTLSVSEMPSHNHDYYFTRIESGSNLGSNGPFGWKTVNYPSASAGWNQPHSHALDIKNQKVMVWKRTA